MAKTTKSKSGKAKGVRVPIAQKTQEAASTKAGLYREINSHYNLPLDASYKRKKTNEGIRVEDHDSAITLDIDAAAQDLGISKYDSNKKRRAEAVEFIEKSLGRKMRKGDTFKWKGRASDTKSGNSNRCAKYFFSNAKSKVSGEACEKWNYFAVTSAETDYEAD